jgi:hypothetical protein
LAYRPITLRVLRRRAWLIALGALGGLAIALAISSAIVSATCAFTVRTTGPYQPPYQQERLTRTYARLLPEDPGIAAAAAANAGLSPGFVEDHLAMTAERETNIFYVRFTAGDAETATRGLEGVVEALRTGTDGVGTPLKKTVAPITRPTVNSGMSKKKAGALGLLIGFAAAVAIALALDRRRPRVDGLEDLAALLPLPVSQLRSDQLGRVSLLPGAGEAEVALLPVKGPRRSAVGEPAAVPRKGPGPCALLVEPGTPAVEVEEAFRSALAGGRRLIAALLVRKRPPWARRAKEVEVGG